MSLFVKLREKTKTKNPANALSLFTPLLVLDRLVAFVENSPLNEIHIPFLMTPASPLFRVPNCSPLMT